MEAVYGAGAGGGGDWIEARDTLRQWREEDVRKSMKTVELGAFLLKNRKSDLGNEGTVGPDQIDYLFLGPYLPIFCKIKN